MDINKIRKEAKKRLEIGQYTGGNDYITIRPLTRSQQTDAQRAKTTGLNLAKMTEAMAKNPQFDMTNPADQAELIRLYPDIIDPAGMDNGEKYARTIMTAAIDPIEHSIVDNDKPVVINDEYIALIWDFFPELTDYIVKEIETLTEEYTLKKKI